MADKFVFLRLNDRTRLPAHLRGAVAAIGNFDGVHQGHQAVLSAALAEACRTGKRAIVLSFEPHPRSLFKPESPVYRLTEAAQKAEHFRALGFSAVIEQDFTHDFAALSAEDFVRIVLKADLGVSCVVAGANFHFGHKRQGTPAYLREAGRIFGFKTLLIDGVKDESGEFISSSRIRAALSCGDIKEANRLLGRPYTVRAEIIRGQKLGRKLGFPTANMALPPQTALKFGIYAVCFRVNGALYQGVASFGRRPTVENDGRPLLETYIFGFDGDIYGREAEVLFIGFIRPEEKFASVDSLIAQMKKDEQTAKELLAEANLPPAACAD